MQKMDMWKMGMYTMDMQINGHVAIGHVGKWACRKLGMQ